jgi:hypothetical protein
VRGGPGTYADQLLQEHDDPRRPQDLAGRLSRKNKYGCEVYLKLTVIDDVLIVSFKELAP